MKYYKVTVSHDGITHASAAWYNLPPSYVVKYKVGEWVEAPSGTRLFVFENREAAMGFAATLTAGSRYTHTRYEVWECEIVNRAPMHLARTTLDMSPASIMEWWSTYRDPVFQYTTKMRGGKWDSVTPPPHTVGCDAVKLVRPAVPNYT